MHGLINRSIQCFIRDAYGPETWEKAAENAELGIDGFEALSTYDDAMTSRLILAASALLGKPHVEFLEDLGTYLASDPSLENLRRLLRFGGETFAEFLHSIDDLPDRARLAVPDLDVPGLDLRDHHSGSYTLGVTFRMAGVGYVIVGILRALADDYGCLAVVEHLGGSRRVETISIQLLEVDYSVGRQFNLAVPGSLS